MAEPIEHVIEYFSVRDRFKFEPTVARLEDELRQLPTEYVVWACSLLAHQLAGAGRLNRAFQLSAVDAFVPRMLRSDVQRAITDGQLFIYEDQLLGLTRVAIEVGSDQEVPDLGEEQQKAFFWALALYGDLHSDEFKVHADPYQEMAANAMRGLRRRRPSAP